MPRFDFKTTSIQRSLQSQVIWFVNYNDDDDDNNNNTNNNDDDDDDDDNNNK